jgi:monoamine oxidase
VRLVFDQDGRIRELSARRVISSVPFSVLREVDGIFALQMSALKKDCIREMSYGTNGKMMLGFTEKHWRHGLARAHDRVPASNGMVYTDLFPQNIWETSRAQPNGAHAGKSGILTTFLGGHDGAKLSSADQQRVVAVIEEVFPGAKTRLDGNEAIFNWTHHVYSRGSYASGRPGQSTRFKSVGRQTELGNKLFFAGEHVASQFAGFMNGACLSGREAAEAVLRSGVIEPANLKKLARVDEAA